MPRRLAAYRAWMVYVGAWSFVGALSWTVTAVYLLRELGLTPLQLVLVGTALEVAYFVCEVPTGVVADLVSRRLSMVVAAALSGAAMLMMGLAPGVPVVLAASALWGAAWTFRSGAEDAWLADEVGVERLGSAYQRGAQVERVTGLVGIAAAVGLATVDVRLPLVAAGAAALLLAGYVALGMPEDGFTRPATAVGPGRRGTAHLREAVGTARAGVGIVRAHPVLLLVVGIALVMGAWSEGFDRLWEAHLLLDVGLPPLGGLSDVAWFGVVGAGTLVLSYAVAAPLVPRVERFGQAGLARYLLLLFGLLMLLALGFALAGSLWAAIGAFWATTVVRELISAPYRTWLNASIADSRTRATVLSVLGVAGSAGEWGGGPVLGWVGTRWSVRVALASGALVLSPALVLLGRAVRHHGRVDASLATTADR